MVGMIRIIGAVITCICLVHVTAGQVNPQECRSLIDLFMVIDGSDSISSDDFAKLRLAIEALVDTIDLGEHKARVGMLVYSSHIPLMSKHPFSYNRNDLVRYARTLQHPRDGTKTGLGLEHMIDIFDKHGRNNAPHVCIVITDGISKNRTNTAYQAHVAASMGISMFAMGIGYKVNYTELKDIASSEQQITTITNFGELQNTLASMMVTICPCPIPPTLPHSFCNDGPRAIGTQRTYICQPGYMLVGNPTITCQNDFTWTAISPDFRCVPCSTNTPVVDYSRCLDGDLTIGTQRTYQCLDGYRQTGNPHIMCQQDATWSQPSIQCVPCGEPMPPMYGVCGGGNLTIGSKRTLSCQDATGYRATGNPYIECVDDPNELTPVWKYNGFECLPCGEPTPPTHAECGTGHYTIGASRTLHCKPGYQPFGNPNIYCVDDDLTLPAPHWQLSDFRCRPPCGEPNLPPFASCAAGDYTIGSTRTMQCLDVGYKAIGHPIMECVDDINQPGPYWRYNFECVPCGEPQVPMNVLYEAGVYTIASTRALKCDTGYKGIGLPSMQCVNDPSVDLPYWSYNFECVPCDVPEAPLNAICDAGPSTLVGTTRTLHCQPGYKAVGQPIMQCMADNNALRPYWSYNFECVPCGEPMAPMYGVCGGGDVTIGSKRTLSCQDATGYRATGNPYIECVDDPNELTPVWKYNGFECLPCGEPSPPTHAECGAGHNTIGASRTLHCKPGYQPFGNPNIYCVDNDLSLPAPHWQLNDFRCRPPCGEPNLPPFASCAAGDYTIGSTRTMQCLDVGYKAIGHPIMECVDDINQPGPYWRYNFECVPCGEPQVPMNVLYEAGAYTIASTRALKCDTGYKGIGLPSMQCVNDPTVDLPYWSYNFECVPCDVPEAPLNAICDAGPSTLVGTTRTLHCQPGYKAVGQPIMQCMADNNALRPYWSYNFECVPCGEPMAPMYGVCGGGDVTIGSKRTLSCQDATGYRATGNPYIECVDDPNELTPVWKYNGFECLPCGEPKPPTHAECGAGHNTIGASRTLHCKPGYQPFGNPNIYCVDDDLTLPAPHWQLNDFRCRPPCGEPNLPPFASCAAGDYTIGSTRTMQCLDVGYKAIGHPTMECVDDINQPEPYWRYNFECVPCGEPQVPMNILYEAGAYTIASTRALKCDTGYKGIGLPSMQCVNDPTVDLPYWSYNFECVPCDVPEAPLNAICDAGPSTLVGTTRTLHCQPGYKAVGQPIMQCMADNNALRPYWSYNFECVPCGEPMAPMYGVCGGGDVTIGSKRTLSCQDATGYRATGNPYIECVDDPNELTPVWKYNGFECLPCGEPKPPTHAECGAGHNTIGASRTLHCKPGYQPFGNPNIYCVDDDLSLPAPHWQLSDFRCRPPCGEPNLPPFASCAAGDYTIGSTRALECKPGYVKIGDPLIHCIDDPNLAAPYWEHNFQCVACGDTPLIPHGSCGGGENTINAVRQLSCDVDYHPVGNPQIQCMTIPGQDTPVWTPDFDFRCVQCNNPPYFENAFCNDGPNTVGTIRQYYCNDEDLYTMQGPGTGQLECNEYGEWVGPQFSCEAVVITTPIPTSPDPTLCDSCRYLNGVGYNRHPTDCSQYVQCYVGNTGLEPVYRPCPYGQFWDHNDLTCKRSQNVYCPYDKCAKDLTLGNYAHSDPNNCCAYWECSNGKSYGKCCPEGHAYSALKHACVADPTCVSSCLKTEQIEPLACSTKRIESNDATYLQHIGNGIYVIMPCAPGTVYSDTQCGCITSHKPSTSPGVPIGCVPELDLSLAGGKFTDTSRNKAAVSVDGVTIQDNAAFFDGKSRLSFNLMSNAEFGEEVVIKFRYLETEDDQLQALLTNSDCGDDPSIIIAKMEGHVLMGAKADYPNSFAIPTQAHLWKEVIYYKSARDLEGMVCGGSYHDALYGNIQKNKCSLHLGFGTGLRNFRGYIKDFQMYRCRPDYMYTFSD